MTGVLNRIVRNAALSCAVIGFLSAFSPAYAAPFDGMNGQWGGEGQANLTDGTHEKIRCNANYTVNGTALKLSIVCASSGGYKVNARSDVRSNDGMLSGKWTETIKTLGGDVSGSASGSTVNANLESGGSPLMRVRIVTTGATQAVNITLQQGGHSVKNVSINMNRK